MARSSAICLLLFLAAVIGHTQTPISGAPVPGLDELDSVMLQVMSTGNSPGAALAITVDGRLVFAHGYGYADTGAMEPVQPDSLFRIASITKPFTAAAILKLIEEGKLQLSTTPFTSILKNLTPPPGATEDPRINQITIQELLNHSAGWDDTIAGVPDPVFAYVDTAANTFGATPPATPDILIRYMLGQPLQHDPGTVTAYSNFGYVVLGQVIERVSGQSYADFVGANIQATAGIQRMHLAGSLLADRLPDEVRYYDYPGAPPAASVFPPVGAPVPAPYGGFSLELMAANGGWMASTMDLLRYVDTMNGQLTPPILQSPPSGSVGYVPPVGDGKAWRFFGSLPGTNSLLHLDTGYQVNGRVSWAALFNTRSGTDASQPDADADAKILQAIQGITAWPSNDLFSTYSGAESSCAFSLSSNSQQISTTGGTLQVSVQDQNYCAWTAVSSAPWISVTAGGVDSDSGAVSLTVDANSGLARQAVVSIAGLSFTISQGGKAGFTLTSAPLTITRGATTGNDSTITLTPAGGFTGAVQLSAAITSSPTSAETIPTLSFGTSNPVNITSASASTATLVVTTIAPTISALHLQNAPANPWPARSGLLASILCFGSFRRRRRLLISMRFLAILCLLCGCISGCGGGRQPAGTPGTTPGAYTVTVTATSGTITATSSFALTVN